MGSISKKASPDVQVRVGGGPQRVGHILHAGGNPARAYTGPAGTSQLSRNCQTWFNLARLQLHESRPGHSLSHRSDTPFRPQRYCSNVSSRFTWTRYRSLPGCGVAFWNKACLLARAMKKDPDKMSEPASIEQPVAAPAWRRWAPLAVLVLAIVTAYSLGLHRYLTLDTVATNRDELLRFVNGNLAVAMLIFMVAYAAAVALSLPGALLLTIVGGFLFGWLLGGTMTVVAATAGAVVVFLIARTSLGETLAGRAGPWMDRLRNGFRENAFSYLLFLRLVPVFPFWLVNIAPALAGVPLPVYVITTFIGIIPGTFAFAILGSGLDSIIAAQKQTFDQCVAARGADQCEFSLDASALVTPQLLAAFVALGFVALIPVAVRKWRALR